MVDITSLQEWLVARSPPTTLHKTLFTLLGLFALYRLKPKRKPQRPFKIPHHTERVLVIGSSSGIGRSIARQYAERGARVCVTGRRAAMVEEVRLECTSARAQTQENKENDVLGVCADFSSVEDMVKVRTLLETEWRGLDTLIVAAGVSALQPLLSLAGVPPTINTLPANTTSSPMYNTPTAPSLTNALTLAQRTSQSNYLGPLLSALTFIPLLLSTSPKPSILLLNSLASVIPAPTRTLYASTKAAGLVLYQALSIEHPQIAFSYVIPSTVEGDFRAGAIDADAGKGIKGKGEGSLWEKDPNAPGHGRGLKREDVARRCVEAIDRGERTVFIPGFMRFAHLLYWIWPKFIERKARDKYNYHYGV